MINVRVKSGIRFSIWRIDKTPSVSFQLLAIHEPHSYFVFEFSVVKSQVKRFEVHNNSQKFFLYKILDLRKKTLNM